MSSSPLLFEPGFKRLICDGQDWTPQAFLSAYRRFAEFIKPHQDANDSPFVFLWARNHIKSLVSYFAIIEAGYSCVLIDPDTKKLSLDHYRNVTPPCMEIKPDPSTPVTALDRDVVFYPGQPGRQLRQQRGYTMIYTHAEDGMARAAMLSQRALQENCRMMRETRFRSDADVSCTILPFSHLFGLTVGVLLTCTDGGSAVIADPAQVQGIDRLLETLHANRVNVIQSVPLFAYLLAKAPGAAEKLASLRDFISGGSKLSDQVFDRFKARTGVEIREGYGISEAGPVCSMHYAGVPVRLSSVGIPMPDCAIRAVAPDGTPLPAGQEGELCVRSGSLMDGYYGDDATTAATLAGGWLRTGDKGFVDAQGYVHLTGLIKDMIDVGGRNVYPPEVKRFLRMHPNVDDVTLTHTTSPLLGAKLVARINLKVRSPEEETALTKWAIQNIESYKLPKQWQFA